MASTSKKKAQADETLDPKDPIESAAADENESAATTDGETQDDQVVEESADAAPDEAVVSQPLTAAASSAGDLNARLTSAARAAATHGGQELTHALNQLELLTGRLKIILPSAIETVEDEGLKSDLQLLSNLL